MTTTTAGLYKIPVEFQFRPKNRRLLVDASGCVYSVVGETVPFPITIGSVSMIIVCEAVTQIRTMDPQRCRRPWEIILGNTFVQDARAGLGDDFVEGQFEQP